MHGFSGIPLKNLALYFLLFSLKPLIYLGFIFVQQALLKYFFSTKLLIAELITQLINSTSQLITQLTYPPEIIEIGDW
jgi:hypothetical protein